MPTSQPTSGPGPGREPPQGPKGEAFLFVLPARLEYRDAARAFLSHLCLRMEAQHHIISAFVEAFNNSVLHAYEGGPPGAISVDVFLGDEILRVVVTDEGRPFEPRDVPPPDLDALPEGGLGLFIIESFMDRVRYDRIDGRNVLSMEKHIAKAEEVALSEHTGAK
ncbi:MAG: ATP-binding protein [Deltaproteobacteria bacterium]|nr:ATP-binding protein [Deltaproteobacteria bacterium]